MTALLMAFCNNHMKQRMLGSSEAIEDMMQI
jgi:hypothetical protein